MTEQELQQLNVTVTMPLQYFNVALSSMHAQPFGQVAPVVATIEQQCKTQIEAALKPAPKAPAGTPATPATPKPNRAARRTKAPKV